MHFLSDTLEQYIEQHSDAEPTLLQALSRETHLKIIQPRMITGHFQGRFLSLLSKIVAPKKYLKLAPIRAILHYVWQRDCLKTVPFIPLK